MKRTYFCLLVFLLAFNLAFPSSCEARAETYLDLESVSAILIDESSGRVLYEKDARARMYPASMTKVLTALIALEYLAPDEIIRVGSEINLVPSDSSMAGFVNGEYITVINLLRGLLIMSGNETANVVALNVARKVSGRENITYSEAEKLFCQIMNERAASYGAVDTHFTNPHGYHNYEHYTTAYDMAIINREALKNDIIKQIVAEEGFMGNSADGRDVPTSVNHDWKTHNGLLITSGTYYYPYATGIKTGYTEEAGYSICASAEKDGERFITVVMFASETGRLADSIKLFNYGFDYYGLEKVYSEGDVVGTVPLANGRWDQNQELELSATEDFTCLINTSELDKIESEFILNEEFIAKTEDSTEIMLEAPIKKGTIVGNVNYLLDGTVMFTSPVLTARDAEKREIISSAKYYIVEFFKTAFTLASLPYLIGGIGALIIIVALITAIRKRRAARRSIYSYNRRRRY